MATASSAGDSSSVVLSNGETMVILNDETGHLVELSHFLIDVMDGILGPLKVND